MPSCYLLAVTQASALDQSSNNWSLFTLIEQLRIPADAPPAGAAGAALPLEVHCYWQLTAAELDRSFEWRLVVTAGTQERAGNAFPLQSNKPRMRIRAQGLHYFFEGETTLRVEWREPGASDWIRCPNFWPLIIERDAGPAPGATPTVQTPH
jgi:hypothetical protein